MLLPLRYLHSKTAAVPFSVNATEISVNVSEIRTIFTLDMPNIFAVSLLR